MVILKYVADIHQRDVLSEEDYAQTFFDIRDERKIIHPKLSAFEGILWSLFYFFFIPAANHFGIFVPLFDECCCEELLLSSP